MQHQELGDLMLALPKVATPSRRRTPEAIASDPSRYDPVALAEWAIANIEDPIELSRQMAIAALQQALRLAQLPLTEQLRQQTLQVEELLVAGDVRLLEMKRRQKQQQEEERQRQEQPESFWTTARCILWELVTWD
eukprot:TRINITY_DN12593_c0_g2_i3.p1 TRINITY_DN12593_c0_g2~~TRINITY_DN12593_c0_g2_i3.p1  ORF type:complete len:136 (+),score=37.44 TRINITY_DN12593_c0_g2_i3:46-453(+)